MMVTRFTLSLNLRMKATLRRKYNTRRRAKRPRLDEFFLREHIFMVMIFAWAFGYRVGIGGSVRTGRHGEHATASDLFWLVEHARFLWTLSGNLSFIPTIYELATL